MTQDTVPANSTAGQLPADIQTMRATVARALDPGTPDSEAPLLLEELRGELQLMIPEVEDIAARQPKDATARYCALACVGEARMKLSVQAAMGPCSDLVYAQKLAGVLAALCDHHDGLIGAAA